MTEKIISIDKVNPGRFFGPDNSNFKYLKSLFPKLKLTSRGDEITVSGSKDDIASFELKIAQMMEYLINHPSLSKNEMDNIIVEEKEYNGSLGIDEAIVFGPKGKIVRARTANQRNLVKQVAKNDVVFAIGPAGTGKTYTAVALAVRALKNKEVKKLILARFCLICK